MSLNAAEMIRTSQELKANFELSGLTIEQASADLEMTSQELDDTLNVASASRPEKVWLVRDYLKQAIEDQGLKPLEYSVLTDGARRMAKMWFPLRKAPRATLGR